MIDLSTHWSGSVASRHLAHLGANVVKIENPKIGDGNRGLAPTVAAEGFSHVALNAGKRSAALDRRAPNWDDVLLRATRWADVVIVGAQPGVAISRGLDFESFVRRKDQIVYCNVSGYGEIGPWAEYPLHGLNGDVVAGLVPVDRSTGHPVAAPFYRSVGTTLAGIHAAVGILEALRRRDAGEGPQRVSTSVWESAMFWQWRDLTVCLNTDAAPPAYADLGSRYSMYETRDDRIILLCPIERKFWEKFCSLLQLPEDWKSIGSWEQTGMDWGKGREEERNVIAQRIKQKTLTEWLPLLENSGIPFSPVFTAQEAARTSQAAATRVLATTCVNGEDILVPNIPIHINSLIGEHPRGPERVSPPPKLGEHTETFLKEIFEVNS